MDDTYAKSQNRENLFDEDEDTFTQASSAQRLINCIVDSMAFYLIWKYLLSKGDAPLLDAVYRYTHSRVLYYTLGCLIVITVFVFLMAFMELATGGKTLGKWLTGTRAINQNGFRLTPKTAFLRSLCRIVPFEPFSALGTPCFPWHDRWSKTYVIDDRRASFAPRQVPTLIPLSQPSTPRIPPRPGPRALRTRPPHPDIQPIAPTPKSPPSAG